MYMGFEKSLLGINILLNLKYCLWNVGVVFIYSVRFIMYLRIIINGLVLLFLCMYFFNR